MTKVRGGPAVHGWVSNANKTPAPCGFTQHYYAIRHRLPSGATGYASAERESTFCPEKDSTAFLWFHAD
ncbi:hypothetical protein [Lacunimicrobium album]